MAKREIFISYSTKDKALADGIVHAIESTGHDCWVAPRNIPYGMPYARAIMDGIDGCEIFIVLITENSIKSDDVLNEIDNAHALKKHIIPIRFSDVKMPRELNYYLSRTQWIRLSPQNINQIPGLLKLENVCPESIPAAKEEGAPTQADEPLPELVKKRWADRSAIVNGALVLLALLAASVFVLPLIGGALNAMFCVSSVLGFVGVALLLLNRENGYAWVFAATLGVVLASAYEFSPSANVCRFFKESSFVISFLPLLVGLGAPLLRFVPCKSGPWGKSCAKMSTFGTILCTVTAIFWLWIIYFDAVTKFGLPPNLRHYVNSFLSYL